MTRYHQALAVGALAISLALPLGFVAAQPGPGNAPPSADQRRDDGPGFGPGMMWGRGQGFGPGMMGWMYGYGDQGARIDYIEGRLAFIKAELRVNAQQMPLWDKFAETVRGNAKTISERRMPFFKRGYWSEPLPERLDQQEKAMNAHLTALRETSAAIKPLYAALDDAQKKTADALLGSPMMGALGVM